MTSAECQRGGAPVGFITELGSIEAASVIYLRLWCNGPNSQTDVLKDFVSSLGASQGERAINAFEELCRLCAQYGRRPLMRHTVNCKCLGADEACFANFISAATDGNRNDAMLIATLLVRPDVAPLITELAANFGLALRRMNLCAPKDLMGTEPIPSSQSTTIH